MNNLNIINEQKYKLQYSSILLDIFNQVMIAENIIKKTELNLIIINKEQMLDLQKKYRDKDYVTDILSFPFDYDVHEEELGYILLGDIYICFEKIIEQAKEYDHTEKREWSYLFCHGIYHLLGYDHIKRKEKKAMNSKVSQIMCKINVDRKQKC